MTQQLKYRTLFKVEVYHQFFLNDGETEFTGMTDTEKETQLDKYNFQDVFDIYPTSKTERLLSGHQLRMKKSNTGFIIFSRIDGGHRNERLPFIDLDKDLELRFTVKIKDPYFENYSNLSRDPERLYYFTNYNKYGESGFKYIRKTSHSTSVAENFKIEPENTILALSELNSKEAENLFGLISIKMRGYHSAYSPIETDGEIYAAEREFMLLFENNKTYWRYLDGADGSTLYTTSSKKPLTRFGKISITNNSKTYPNPSPKQIVVESNNHYSITFI